MKRRNIGGRYKRVRKKREKEGKEKREKEEYMWEREKKIKDPKKD